MLQGVRTMKPGTRRYTVETLAAGQPRAYADTVHHVRVTFEWIPYKKREPGEEPQFEPSTLKEEHVRRALLGLQCGFTEFDYNKAEKSMDNYFKTRLDWLIEVSPGVWEFHTTSKFTD
jgi:hypothetical protein